MLDRLNTDYATLTPEYQQAALSNKGSILQRMIGPSLVGNPGSSANPPTSLSIAQRGLNLNEDQLMEEAMRVSLKSQKLEEEEEDAIKDANIRSLMGKRRNT